VHIASPNSELPYNVFQFLCRDSHHQLVIPESLSSQLTRCQKEHWSLKKYVEKYNFLENSIFFSLLSSFSSPYFFGPLCNTLSLYLSHINFLEISHLPCFQNNDLQNFIKCISDCKNLQVLILANNRFDPLAVQSILQAIQGKKNLYEKSLKFLSRIFPQRVEFIWEFVESKMLGISGQLKFCCAQKFKKINIKKYRNFRYFSYRGKGNICCTQQK
jgi:hypothetical protein